MSFFMVVPRNISGNLTINGDLNVTGTTTVVDTTTSGKVTIDITDTEALLVRKDADAGDIFTVNTTSSLVLITGRLDITPSAVSVGSLTLTNSAGARTVAQTLVTFDGTVGAVAGGTLFDLNVSMTGASANPLVDIDVSGIYTGNLLDVAYTAAATGTAINLNMTTAVAASALTITEAGIRTTDLVTLTSTATGAVDLLQVNRNGASTGFVFNVDMDAAVGGGFLNLDAGAGARTVALYTITFDGTVGALEGEKSEDVTSRGNPTSRFRTRPHEQYIDFKEE